MKRQPSGRASSACSGRPLVSGGPSAVRLVHSQRTVALQAVCHGAAPSSRFPALCHGPLCCSVSNRDQPRATWCPCTCRFPPTSSPISSDLATPSQGPGTLLAAFTHACAHVHTSLDPTKFKYSQPPSPSTLWRWVRTAISCPMTRVSNFISECFLDVHWSAILAEGLCLYLYQARGEQVRHPFLCVVNLSKRPLSSGMDGCRAKLRHQETLLAERRGASLPACNIK